MLDTSQRLTMSRVASDLKGNAILNIAYEVRALKASGERLADLTIGDFTPEFSIPDELRDGIKHYLDAGETNYPPAMGVARLREAVAAMYQREFGLAYIADEILVGSGTRPLIYSAYNAIVDPGDVIIYGVPSWNNDHYAHIVSARAHEVVTKPEDHFMLTLPAIEAKLGEAVVIALNSPMNPSGTVQTEERLRPICEAILAENSRRAERGAKPVYLLYDQVYWRMVYTGTHVHPVGLYPEMKDYTIYTDGSSKNYAGTGLRVGWAALPPHLVGPMTKYVTHMGAWGPKAEQLALADYLPKAEAQKAYHQRLIAEMRGRLDQLHHVLQEARAAGLNVDSIEPQGGLFLSVYFGLLGQQTPNGQQLATIEDIRKYLLEEGRMAFVPFSAFGDDENEGWFRAAVSGVTRADFAYALPLLRKALLMLA